MSCATCIKRSLELLSPLYFSDTMGDLISVGKATQLQPYPYPHPYPCPYPCPSPCPYPCPYP